MSGCVATSLEHWRVGVGRILIRAVGLTLGARLLSALFSFGVFSQVASSLAPPEAKRVLFFSFVFGFCLATLRTFHLVAAMMDGSESRTCKLRRLRCAASRLRSVMIWAVPLVWALLMVQGVGWPAALAGVILVVLCGQDLDLVRSVLGRHPMLPLLTMVGGFLGMGMLAAGPRSSIGWCAGAFLVQWLPAALMQLVYGRRWLAGPSPSDRLPISQSTHVGNTAGLFLTAAFDGAVLNAPYLLVLPIAAASAVDLALGNRLFVSSLTLFSLVASWVISGDLQHIATRYRMRLSEAFVLIQLTVCLFTGTAYALVYHLITNRPVGPTAMVVFVLVTMAYVIHSAGLRFLLPRLTVRIVIAVYSGALMCFYALLLSQYLSTHADLRVIVGSVVLALSAPPLIFWFLLPSLDD